MKKYGIILTIIVTLCLISTTVIYFPRMKTASAKEITTTQQASQLAKKEVKGARVIEVDEDHDDGILVYEVQLSKGKKEYDLTYRASDAKLISYSWEIYSGYVKRGKGKTISKSKCKKLAKKKVSHGSITSIAKKRSDGIDVYTVKMRKDSKKYELKFHARTGKLLEYEWEISTKYPSSQANASYSKQNTKKPENTKSPQNTNTPQVTDTPQPTQAPQQSNGSQISLDDAKSIALADAGLTASDVTFTQTKSDYEDGILVYDIEFYSGTNKYEYEINASTGAIYSKDIEKKENNISNPSGNIGDTGNTDANISMEQAKQIALDRIGGGTLVKAKYDVDDGVAVYEIEIILNEYEYEVKIHAGTGDILKVEKESIYS